MVIITCSSCKKPLSLDETKLPAKEVTFPCPVCKSKLTVDGRKSQKANGPVPTLEAQRPATTAPPPSMDDGPPVTVSKTLTEFELPETMRKLVAAIREQLIERCRRRIADAGNARAHAERSAGSELADAENRIAGGMERIEQLCRQAEAHVDAVTDFSSAGSDAPPDHSAMPPSRPDLDAALNAIDQRLEPEVGELLASKNIALWPENGLARFGILIGSVVLAYQYWPLFFAWPIIVVISRIFVGIGLHGQYKQCLTTAAEIRAELDAAHVPARLAHERAMHTAGETHATTIAALKEWAAASSRRFHDSCDRLWQVSNFAGADWYSPVWKSWEPDTSPEFGARIGTFVLRADDLRSRWPDLDFTFALPALIPFADELCLLLDARGKAKEAAAEAMQSVIVRTLANTPPGKARFTFIDPVGLGQNVADFMHLGDVNQDLIGGKSWSEPHHIEQQLAELTEHTETVIQKYLRKDFATIRHYNQSAQEVAEPFRFLVVFDFPVNFSDSSARRLVSIVRNGARCGVHTFILRDAAKPLPYGFNLAELSQAATVIEWPDNQGPPIWHDKRLKDATLSTDSVEGYQDLVAKIVRVSGESALQAMKVEVPFEKLLTLSSLPRHAWWKKSSAANLTTPLGPTGARRVQSMTLGEGLAHHVLVVGRTGSGKTNLMHVIVTSLALAYSPEEVHLYLIDFKGGVGFKPYADYRLPHAAVIAIESEREFGMSVLQRLDDELRNRFELFRAAGVDNLASYRARQGGAPLPRVLLIIDEFQEFFTQDDGIAQRARGIFDRIVRQGRSFGLHLLLGTQSLSGSAELSASTRGQMAVRIALPCSEADSRIILADDNTAARSLSRPGEGIYNPTAGSVEGNNPFQVALISDQDVANHLDAINRLAHEHDVKTRPIVFEGNEPASLSECAPLLERVRSGEWSPPRHGGTAWVGEPVAIAPPVRALFSRQAGRHLLIVTREEAEGLGMLNAAWVCLLSHHHPSTARFYVLDFSSADAPWAGFTADIQNAFGHEIHLLNRRSLSTQLNGLVSLVNDRLEAQAPVEHSSYLLVHGLHRARDLRAGDDDYYSRDRDAGPSPAEQLALLLRDGPEAGVHVLAWCDTVSNSKRALDRSLREFGMRLGGAMSASDSDAFLDSPDASRLDKPHRVLYYDEDKPGVLQKLRPYAIPALPWVQEMAAAQKASLESAEVR